MAIIKSSKEIDLMRKAGNILALLRKELENHLNEGVSTKQLDDIAYDFIIKSGATPSFKGYYGFPASICASINEVVVHGIPSEKDILKNGDIISIDLGVNYKGYHADSCWTYKIGEVSKEIQDLMECTKEALFQGLSQIKPGNFIQDIGYQIQQYIKPFKYGIVRDFTGHGIGANLHEDPVIANYGMKGRGIEIKENMVLCVEPMICLGSHKVKILEDGWTTITKDKKPAAHYELMVLVTKDGYEILTPKL